MGMKCVSLQLKRRRTQCSKMNNPTVYSSSRVIASDDCAKQIPLSRYGDCNETRIHIKKHQVEKLKKSPEARP